MIQMQRHRNINMQILHGVNHNVMNTFNPSICLTVPPDTPK